MFNTLLNSFILAQNAMQKAETIIGVSILAIVACFLIWDGFAKSSLVGDKIYKKSLLTICFIVVIIAIVVIILYKKNYILN